MFFEPAPLPPASSLAARLGSILQSPGVPDSLVAEKKCREFRRLSRFLRNLNSKTSANSAVCEASSLRDVAGNYFVAAGNQYRLLDRSGESSQNRSSRAEAGAGAAANLGPRADARARPDLRLACDEHRWIDVRRIRDDPAFASIRISPLEGVALECLVFPSIVGETVQKQGAKRLGVDLTKTWGRLCARRIRTQGNGAPPPIRGRVRQSILGGAQ